MTVSGSGPTPGAVEGAGSAVAPTGAQVRAGSDMFGAARGGDTSGFGEAVTRVVVDRGELTLHVRPERVADVAKHLRDDADQRYEMLLGVSGVDYPNQAERFHVVYHLMSMTYRRRIRLETQVPLERPHVASVTGVYPTADFHERETWDMFGVVFDGHPALTRILMPDDWDGHPQRKDYPLGGVPVEYKGAQIPPPDERRSYA